MNKKAIGNPIIPKESEFLFWIFFLLLGIFVAVTGTFSKFAMGTWSGSHVHLAGMVLSLLGTCGIFFYIYRLRSQAKANLFLVGGFIAVLLVSIFLLLRFDNIHVPFRPIYLMVAPVVFAHFLHRVLTKEMKNNGSTDE